MPNNHLLNILVCLKNGLKNDCLKNDTSFKQEASFKQTSMIRIQVSTASQGECASSRQNSAGLMPEIMGKWSVGVGCRHPVTICKASIQDLSTVYGDCERCNTRLVLSTQLLSRLEIERLCAVLWYLYLILSLQVISTM